MRIGFVRVFVSDFARALDFYSGTLGLPVDVKDERFGWAQFHAGEDVALAIERHDEPGEKLVGRYVGVTLLVDDLAATYERGEACGRVSPAAREAAVGRHPRGASRSRWERAHAHGKPRRLGAR